MKWQILHVIQYIQIQASIRATLAFIPKEQTFFLQLQSAIKIFKVSHNLKHFSVKTWVVTNSLGIVIVY